MSNSLDSNQDQRSVGPDQYQNCLHRLSSRPHEFIFLENIIRLFHTFLCNRTQNLQRVIISSHTDRL